MRILLIVISILTIAWSGYWFAGQAGLKHAFTLWFEDRRADGWVAEYSALDVQGFPNRFDTSFSDLSLADPETGLAWEAPFFQILALSYRPNHVIAAWPETQLIATPEEKFQLDSQEMRASLVLDADPDLPLNRATLTAQSIRVAPLNTSERTTVESLRLGVERQPARPTTYRLGVAADGLSPSLDWRVQLDPSGQLPDQLDAFNADVLIKFDAPWDRNAIETARPQPEEIDIKLIEAHWGRMHLQVAGQVNIDNRGLPEGEIVVKARNWRDILAMAVSSGSVPEEFSGPLESGLSLIAQLAGNPETLDIPLRFANGKTLLGPVPLGPAPVLRLR